MSPLNNNLEYLVNRLTEGCTDGLGLLHHYYAQKTAQNSSTITFYLCKYYKNIGKKAVVSQQVNS